MNNNMYSQDGNTGGFQPPPPQPSGYTPPPVYGGQQYNPQERASSAAIWALVLGIVSWVLCGFIAAIPAWIVGKKELNAIKEGRSSQAGKTMAQVGMWLGIVQVIFSVLAIFALLAYFVFFAAVLSSN
jgi:hypothetical protein